MLLQVTDPPHTNPYIFTLIPTLHTTTPKSSCCCRRLTPSLRLIHIFYPHIILIPLPNHHAATAGDWPPFRLIHIYLHSFQHHIFTLIMLLLQADINAKDYEISELNSGLQVVHIDKYTVTYSSMYIHPCMFTHTNAPRITKNRITTIWQPLPDNHHYHNSWRRSNGTPYLYHILYVSLTTFSTYPWWHHNIKLLIITSHTVPYRTIPCRTMQ